MIDVFEGQIDQILSCVSVDILFQPTNIVLRA